MFHVLSTALEPRFSWTILLGLLLAFGASLMMYTLVVLRWTTHRTWVSLSDWASERRLKIASKSLTDLPPPLDRLREAGAVVRLRVGDKQTTMIQIQIGDGADANAGRWNVVIRKSPRLHAPAALRPEQVTASLIDQFELTTFHSLSTTRFAALGVDLKSAQQLIHSPARALLPPDIGLLVVGEQIVLDFSTRPFDPVELDRMLSVVNQIVQAI